MSAPDAPGGLAVLQDLLNTVAGGREKQPSDLIGGAAAAPAWSDAVAERGWPAQRLGRDGAAALRALRQTIRTVLHAELGADGSGRVEIESSRGVGTILGAVPAKMLAQERGGWPRLHCARGGCATWPSSTAPAPARRGTTSRTCSNHVNLHNERDVGGTGVAGR